MSKPFDFKELRKPQRHPNACCCICRKKDHTAGECPDRKLARMKVMYSFDLTEK
jgi:hypothetical protein